MASSIFPLANSPIFIPSDWALPDKALTREYADLNYLKFPLGQGTETLPGLAVSGATTTGSLVTGTLSSTSIATPIQLQLGYLVANLTNFSFTSKSSAYGGSNNCFFGYNTAANITSGGTNTGFGQFQTLNSLTTGGSNCALGNQALKSITTASSNTSIGVNSGENATGSFNTFIGAFADTASPHTATNSTAIGYNSKITASNQIVLGTNTETVIIPNTIAYSYTTTPTFTSANIGFISSTSSSEQTFISTERTIATLSSVPVGVWLFCGYANIFSQTGPNIFTIFRLYGGATLLFSTTNQKPVTASDQFCVPIIFVVSNTTSQDYTLRVFATAGTVTSGGLANSFRATRIA